MELTVFQILSNTYGFPARTVGLASPPLTRCTASFGHTRRLPSASTPIASFSNFLLAICHLPAIIWCFVGCNMLANEHHG